MNRKRLIAGLTSLAVLALLVIAGVGFLLSRLKTEPRAQQKALVSELGYCSSNDLKPCIVSFSVDADGGMLVNMLIPAASYPYFYLTISNASTTNRYDCQQVEDFPTNIYCTGAEMYPGAVLQFNLVALKDDAVLAEGNFAIIGLLLSNPPEEATEAPVATEPPTESPTPFLLEIFTPLPNDVTATPSYPNPTSYP